MNIADNIVNMDALAKRAIKAAYAYEAGVAKQDAGRHDAIAAVIEYGKALLDGRKRYPSNNDFHDWIKANGIDQIKPFDSMQERSNAQAIAELVIGNAPYDAFLACPNTRPVDIMKWWRAKNISHGRKPRVNKIEAAAEALRDTDGNLPTSKALAQAAGVHSRNADNALRVKKAVDEAVAEAIATTKAEMEVKFNDATIKFTKAQDHHVEARLRALTKQLEKDFAARTDELQKRFAFEVNEAAKAQCEQQFPHLRQREAAVYKSEKYLKEVMNNHEPIFTESEFSDIRKACHPDNSATKETRERAFISVNLKKLQLTGKK